MSYILNVVGDIYSASKTGSMVFTPLKTAETLLDVFARKDGNGKIYQFRFRYSGYYLKATKNKLITITSIRTDPETFWTIEDLTGRIIDKYDFKYEAVIKDLPLDKIDPNKINIAEVLAPTMPHADEKLVQIGDHDTPENYNLHPSDPSYIWNAATNTENYTPSKSMYEKELPKDNNNMMLMLAAAGAVLVLVVVMKK
jgi:hypothetical protein